MATAVQENGTTPSMSPLYAKASRKVRGYKAAREALYDMGPDEREQHAPKSLKGKSRKVFIDTGKTYAEQTDEAQAKRQANPGSGNPSGSKDEGLTPKTMAEELGITPRQFRIFLRSKDLNVGRGKRYHFPKAEAAKLVKEYREVHADDEE